MYESSPNSLQTIDSLLDSDDGRRAYHASKTALTENLRQLAHLWLPKRLRMLPADKKTLLLKGLEHVKDALRIDSNDHGSIKLIVAITNKLKDSTHLGGFEQKKVTDLHLQYLEKYLLLEPNDYEARFFRARCCFAILNAPALLRPLYKAAFFDPPSRSLEEILTDFEEVERILTDRRCLLENKYFLALCYLKKGETENAVAVLLLIDEYEPTDHDERVVQMNARKLLQKLVK